MCMEPIEPRYNRAFLERAHKSCSSHKDEILASDMCDFFYCEETFEPKEIEEWIEENIAAGEAAICPKCG